MQLKDSLFKITGLSETDNRLTYNIQLNPSHFVYQAHFPGNPVTPGVCIIQMIKELAMDRIQSILFLEKATKIKFLNVINPLENEHVNVELTITGNDGTYRIDANVTSSDTTFSKLSLILTNNRAA